jgi:signal transduction histidine kinase
LFSIISKRILKYEEDKINIYTTNIAYDLENYYKNSSKINNNFEEIYNFLEKFIQQPSNPIWKTIITDKKGILLYGSNIKFEEIKTKGKNYSKYPSVKNALIGNWGLKEVKINNKKYYTSSNFVPKIGWIVIVDVPKNIIINQVTSMIFPLIILTFLLLLFLLFTGIIYINRILNPLEKLTMSMKEYSKSGSVNPIKIKGKNEISSAIKTFNNMVSERKKLEKEILEISENERIRIGHDIHDDLGQILTGISFQLIMLEKGLKKEKKNIFNETSELLSKAINKSRLIARGLSPVSMNENGFVIAIEELTKNIEKIYKIKCSFKNIENIQIMDHIIALNLFYIAQESINNSIKHAKPKEIIVILKRIKNEIILEIKDDGQGIQNSNKEGMGLKIMKYRVSMINGKLEIKSDKNKGTIIRCSFNKN